MLFEIKTEYTLIRWLFKGATSLKASHLEKCSLSFSSWLFVIRVNLLHPYHPCSFMVYYYLFGVFFYLRNYYIQLSFSLSVSLDKAKLTQMS